MWSVRVSRDMRLIVHTTDASLRRCDVDHHDEAYRWAERRTLDTPPKTGAAPLVEMRETVQDIIVPPDVTAAQPAHPSALDLVFYNAGQFPAERRGRAFVVLKGSWNRSEPPGDTGVRVPFQDGKPAGDYENFMTSFWAAGERRAEVWGRPAALAIARDDSLLVADDTGGTIWKVTYTGAAQAGAPAAATTGTADGQGQK